MTTRNLINGKNPKKHSKDKIVAYCFNRWQKSIGNAKYELFWINIRVSLYNE